MRLCVEAVVDGAVGREKSLCGTLGLEPLLLSFPPSDREVAVLRPVVLAHPASSVLVQNPELSQRCAIGSQLVRRDRLGMNALVLEEQAQKLHGRRRIPACLHENVEHLALIVDGAPKPQALSLDTDHEASGAGEFHPRALSEPDVILSHHPAPIVRPGPWIRGQWANSRGWRCATRKSQCRERRLCLSRDLYFPEAHRAR